MSNGGIIVLLIGVVAASIVVPVLHLAHVRTNAVLDGVPVMLNLHPSQQSILHTLQANGGSAITMDYNTLLDTVGTVLVTTGVIFVYLFLKNR